MNRNAIFSIAILILIGGGFYFWYWRTPPAAPPESPAATPGELGERLQELRRLKGITLDTSFFQDSFFRSLEAPVGLSPEARRAGTTTPGAEGAGRVNPFLPF